MACDFWYQWGFHKLSIQYYVITQWSIVIITAYRLYFSALLHFTQVEGRVTLLVSTSQLLSNPNHNTLWFKSNKHSVYELASMSKNNTLQSYTIRYIICCDPAATVNLCDLLTLTCKVHWCCTHTVWSTLATLVHCSLLTFCYYSKLQQLWTIWISSSIIKLQQTTKHCDDLECPSHVYWFVNHFIHRCSVN